MSDFIDKNIKIVSWEKKTAKNGNPFLTITDQDGDKYVLWPKKKDGDLSVAGAQWKEMGLDEGSDVNVSWVAETYTFEGEERTSNKIVGFRETTETVKTTPSYNGKSNGVKTEEPVRVPIQDGHGRRLALHGFINARLANNDIDTVRSEITKLLALEDYVEESLNGKVDPVEFTSREVDAPIDARDIPFR